MSAVHDAERILVTNSFMNMQHMTPTAKHSHTADCHHHESASVPGVQSDSGTLLLETNNLFIYCKNELKGKAVKEAQSFCFNLTTHLRVDPEYEAEGFIHCDGQPLQRSGHHSYYLKVLKGKLSSEHREAPVRYVICRPWL